ncbi:hypothetical protein BDF22DRAFT_734520 [Syncephalis plumigaleata]|nr:hypothetical protein BDF22DRAFT_734520 [Syncephalis plumigaleata]
MSNHMLKDTCELLERMVDTFQPEADISVIKEIGRRREVIEQIQTHETDKVHEQLKTLSRELEMAKAKAIRPAAAPSEEEHTNKMVQLDREKFLLAKEIQDYEQEGRDLEAQLQQAKEELKKLDSQMNLITPETDGIALVLKMYRELGVDQGSMPLDKYHIFKFNHQMDMMYTNYHWTRMNRNSIMLIVSGRCAPNYT